MGAVSYYELQKKIPAPLDVGKLYDVWEVFAYGDFEAFKLAVAMHLEFNQNIDRRGQADLLCVDSDGSALDDPFFFELLQIAPNGLS